MKIYPKITIVTPSYNHGEFLEQTILSIIKQNYPNLEYIIIDGGSTDNTIEIIKRYEQHITYWVSEKDNGQSHAINKGFARATGDWGIWINSDDMLAPGALHKIAETLARAPKNTMLMGQYHEVDRYGENPKLKHSKIRTLEELVDIQHHWRKGGNQIGQQALFFSLDLWRKVGGLDENNHTSMDYDLWGRMMLAGGVIEPVDELLGIFRTYEGQKISDRHKTSKGIIACAKNLIRSATHWPPGKKRKALLKVYRYEWKYYYHHVRSLMGVKRRLKSFMASAK